MRNWERIKEIRTDMSDYVLHCTRGTSVKQDAFAVLKKILQDGYFQASDAKKLIGPFRRLKSTIEGPYNAVCFTEQPLQFFIQSIKANHRYTEFAIAVKKDELFSYGGRPIIYSDEATLTQLPDELKYLWAHYDPTALWQKERDNYPIDFTHEREWRARPNKPKNKKLGLYSDFSFPPEFPLLPYLEDRVPIFLPNRKDTLDFTSPHFIILVDSKERKAELAEWIKDNCGKISAKGGYWQKYAIALGIVGTTQILSFEEVEETRLGRIEDFLNE